MRLKNIIYRLAKLAAEVCLAPSYRNDLEQLGGGGGPLIFFGCKLF